MEEDLAKRNHAFTARPAILATQSRFISPRLKPRRLCAKENHMLAEFDLTGRKALVTGAGRGIGKGIALVLAEAGCDVAVTSFGQENADKVAAEIKALGRKGFGYAADGTKVAPMEAVKARVLSDLGGLDILVNCIGDAIRGSVAPM